MEDYIGLIVIFCIFVLPFLLSIVNEWIEKFKRADKIVREEYKLQEKQNKINEDIKKNEEILKENKQVCQDIQHIITDNTQNNEWLANLISEYYSARDEARQIMLRIKKNPAKKSSDIVGEVKREKRELVKENKKLEYQLNFLKQYFPIVEDAIQLTKEEMTEAFDTIYREKESNDEYEILKEYLTPKEYAQMSNIEKYQLALDRYNARKKKSLWQVGVSYERYIGYVYENERYNVIYNGALAGKSDFGRDIIAENKNEILIIQCKYWKKESTIHENAIFQLYGTMILKQLETSKQVKGILVTTTKVSDTAKKVAKHLNIIIRENEVFDKSYPCIKCNINRTTKEKIYHLPFDQQYDRIKIDIDNGEKYVNTVLEAENLGFRRAKKHILNNQE